MTRSQVTLDDIYLYECGYYKDENGKIKKMKNDKNGLKKAVKKHLKEDIKESKESIREDKMLMKKAKKGKK